MNNKFWNWYKKNTEKIHKINMTMYLAAELQSIIVFYYGVFTGKFRELLDALRYTDTGYFSDYWGFVLITINLFVVLMAVEFTTDYLNEELSFRS